MIKLAKHLANRLNFKLDNNKPNTYVYHNGKKDMELDIDYGCLYLYIYDNPKTFNMYNGMQAVRQLAEILGYDNTGRY
jgi:hypothetical protein